MTRRDEGQIAEIAGLQNIANATTRRLLDLKATVPYPLPKLSRRRRLAWWFKERKRRVVDAWAVLRGRYPEDY